MAITVAQHSHFVEWYGCLRECFDGHTKGLEKALPSMLLVFFESVEQGLGHIWGKNSAPLKMIDFPRLSQFEGIKMFWAPPRLTGELKQPRRRGQQKRDKFSY